MTYKYAAELASLPLTSVQCPCQEATSQSGRVYRLVWLPETDKVNFVPRTLVPGVPRKIKVIAPSLTESEVKKAETNACDEWAISLHTDPEASRQLCKVFKKLPYTHIAEIQLANEHGLCTPLDQNQHFNLHEAAGVDLRTAITSVQPL